MIDCKIAPPDAILSFQAAERRESDQNKSPRPTAVFRGRTRFTSSLTNSVIDGGRPRHHLRGGHRGSHQRNRRPAQRRHSPGGRNPWRCPRRVHPRPGRRPTSPSALTKANGTWMKPGRLHLPDFDCQRKSICIPNDTTQTKHVPLTAGGATCCAARTKKNGDLVRQFNFPGASDHRHAVGDSATHHRCQASTGERTTRTPLEGAGNTLTSSHGVVKTDRSWSAEAYPMQIRSEASE